MNSLALNNNESRQNNSNILPEEDKCEENFEDIEESKNFPRNPQIQNHDTIESLILAQVFLF